MIYQIFNMFGQAFSAGWKCIVDLVEASGMTKPVFIGLLVTLNVLLIVFGTLRARAFSGGDRAEPVDDLSPEEEFTRDVDKARYRMLVSERARNDIKASRKAAARDRNLGKKEGWYK